MACHAAGAVADVQWHPFGPDAFRAADREGKLLFIDVGIEGCTACRRMAEVTLTHPEVVRRLNAGFVAISVDAEARPDIGARYSDWAWPALIFLTPDGTQVLAIRGNRTPRNFIPVLDELKARQAAGTLSADGLAPLAAAAAPEPFGLEAVRRRVRAQLDGQLNERLGSWRRNGVGATSGYRQQHLLFRGHMYANGELESLGLKTADSFLELLDPVWGGVFEAYVERGAGDAAGPALRPGHHIPEKRIGSQASALHVFASAYRLTGDVRYRTAIDRVDAYLQSWLAAPDGTYYTSQEDAAPRLTPRVDVATYWSLTSEHERRQFGIPPIDHAVYTDKNAELALAYLAAYDATGDPNHLALARRAVTALLEQRSTGDGWVRQAQSSERAASDARMRPLVESEQPFLAAQAWLGRALLGLYGATGERGWLDRARVLAGAMRRHLEDRDVGGFFDAPALERGIPLPRVKPLELNAVAAHFLYDLAVFARDAALFELAERALRAVAAPAAIRREGKVTAQLGLVVEKMAAAYVEFSIVGSPGEADARALFEASRGVYHPRKLVHYEPPGRYPERPRPALYICNPDFCTVPIEDPRAITAHLEDFRAPAQTRASAAPPPQPAVGAIPGSAPGAAPGPAPSA